MEEYIKKVEGLAALAGRILLSAIFIWSGFGKITGWEQTAGYMAAKGMPLIPFFLVLSIAFELGGGLSLLTGFLGRWGALALFAFLIPTTLIFHNFWAAAPAEKMMQTVNFMKNVAIMGGLLMAFRFGPGEFSVDNWWRKAKGTQT